MAELRTGRPYQLVALNVGHGVVSDKAMSNLHLTSTVVWLTPGSEKEACRKDDMQIKKRYAKKKGTAGEAFLDK